MLTWTWPYMVYPSIVLVGSKNKKNYNTQSYELIKLASSKDINCLQLLHLEKLQYTNYKMQ